jgi:hypothetical protein
MTTSRTTSRVIIILLFLAGLLLLRKPVFGQTLPTVPACRIDSISCPATLPGITVRQDLAAQWR